MKSIIKYCSLILLGANIFAATLNAASVNWTKATISSDLDISNVGTEIGAFNFGTSASPTINGVAFAGITPGAPYGNNAFAFGSSSAPFSSLSADYQTLLQSGSFRPDTAPFGFTDLTIGQEYQFQIWVNDSRALAANRTLTLTGGANSITLSQNTTGTDGGLGQFAIGTFVADATNQDISAAGTLEDGTTPGGTLINGYRFSAVPEPQTYLMLGITGLFMGIVVIRRRKPRI